MEVRDLNRPPQTEREFIVIVGRMDTVFDLETEHYSLNAARRAAARIHRFGGEHVIVVRRMMTQGDPALDRLDPLHVWNGRRRQYFGIELDGRTIHEDTDWRNCLRIAQERARDFGSVQVVMETCGALVVEVMSDGQTFEWHNGYGPEA